MSFYSLIFTIIDSLINIVADTGVEPAISEGL